MRRHVSADVIEELTHDMLAQRIADFTGRRARLVRHESPRANQVGEGICIHTQILFPNELEVAAEFLCTPIRYEHEFKLALDPETPVNGCRPGWKRHRWANPVGRKYGSTWVNFTTKPFSPKVPRPRTSVPYAMYTCSMKMTEDGRKYVAEQGLSEEEPLKLGMGAKSKQFVEKSAEFYAKA